ncbi:uncharacterized protein LOC129222474 [Uloborus diversus]|uniref:uncharacterized protein LOC129222474 n=1 Tax=Uloborus diversus TaxID=327109 RepID=UPI0024093459|nr:uncharacterized protein LOC129222474 [Uloborus diversus]
MISIYCFLLAVSPAASLQVECTLHQLFGCLESLRSVTQGNDLTLATTRQELSDVCRNLKKSVLCVDEHMKSCFTATQRKVFNQVVAGARQFLLELCVSGKIQDTYLRHSPCYKNVSLSEEKCALKYQYLIQLSENVDKGRDVDEGLRESCCAFNAFVLCKNIHVDKDCGKEAGQFLRQHLDRISSPLIHEHCAHYMYATDACSTSRASISTNYGFLFLSFSLLMRLLT